LVGEGPDPEGGIAQPGVRSREADARGTPGRAVHDAGGNSGHFPAQSPIRARAGSRGAGRRLAGPVRIQESASSGRMAAG